MAPPVNGRASLRDRDRRRGVEVPLHAYTLASVRLRAFRVPPIDNAVYVLADARKDALVIDPSYGERQVLELVRGEGLHVVEVLNTHGHPDHTAGDAAVTSATGARLAIHGRDAYRLEAVAADRLLEEGDESTLADLRLVVLHTPGHSEGSVCFHLERERALFSGDTLFNAGLGRVDLPGGDARAMVESLRRLMTLPPETVVYPGHGSKTTIGAEQPWVSGLSASELAPGSAERMQRS